MTRHFGWFYFGRRCLAIFASSSTSTETRFNWAIQFVIKLIEHKIQPTQEFSSEQKMFFVASGKNPEPIRVPTIEPRLYLNPLSTLLFDLAQSNKIKSNRTKSDRAIRTSNARYKAWQAVGRQRAHETQLQSQFVLVTESFLHRALRLAFAVSKRVLRNLALLSRCYMVSRLVRKHVRLAEQ